MNSQRKAKVLKLLEGTIFHLEDTETQKPLTL